MSPDDQQHVQDPVHLGDGVYAQFDGYHMVLRANHHEDPHPIAIEPAVWEQLLAHAARVNKAYQTQYFSGVPSEETTDSR